MKYFYIIVIICLCCSCGSSRYSSFDYNRSKNPWIQAFKDKVFFSALRESYKNDSIFSLIEDRDALNPYDGLSLSAEIKAKELGIKLITDMPPPLMCESCKEGDNYYMAVSLHYYNSKQLDSIAKSEFKKYKRSDPGY